MARGWKATQVAEALLPDANTVRNQVKSDRQNGVPALRSVADVASDCGPAGAEVAVLDAYLQIEYAAQAKEGAPWVKEKLDIADNGSGMAAMRHRVDFVYTKTKLVPGKAELADQDAYFVDHEDLKHAQGGRVVFFFMDTVHPQHNAVVACGWTSRGQVHENRSNMGRRSVNIDGPISPEDLESLMRFDDNPNAASTIGPF